MFTTITARMPGTCKRCGQSFEAGTRIRYGGRGRTYHLAAECSASKHDTRSRSARDTIEARALDIDRMLGDGAAYIAREV